MIDKIQVSMWIQTPLKHLVDNENLNLTKFVNDSLETYFSVDTTDAIEKEISVKKAEIKILEQRISDIVSKKDVVNAKDVVQEQAFAELREFYRSLAERGASQEEKMLWIMVPKKIARCKILGKTPIEVLDELDAWYDGKKTS